MSTQAPPLLPPGVSAGDFAAALDELAATCSVLTSEEELAGFRDPFQYSTWEEYAASAVVMPETVEEVQEIVRIANEHRIPLWTHGQGMNNGYGGPAPRVDGSVDRQPAEHEQGAGDRRGAARTRSSSRACAGSTCTTRSGPGGHKLMVSIPDLGWGSVVGNFLENGATYLPQSRRTWPRTAAWRSCSRTAR